MSFRAVQFAKGIKLAALAKARRTRESLQTDNSAKNGRAHFAGTSFFNILHLTALRPNAGVFFCLRF